MRPICSNCGMKPAAINYRKNGFAHYRSACDGCAKVTKPKIPVWQQMGYQKKDCCDRCGFTSSHPEQFNVYHVDGNLRNCRYSNLKTVCANCQRILHTLGHRWKPGDLTPDL